MLTIKRLDPADVKCLDKEYNRFQVRSNSNFDWYEKDSFLECSNSIYTITGDICNSNKDDLVDDIYSIIGAKRVELDRLNYIDNLEYYCSPYNKNNIDLVYSIDFLYMNSINFYSFKIKEFIFKELLNSCLADKNDAFVVYREKESMLTDECRSALLQFGFELKDTDKFRVCLFIKAPTTQH